MTGLEFLKTLGPTLTALIAAFLFFYNIRKDKKAEKVQERNNFLGGKVNLKNRVALLEGNWFYLNRVSSEQGRLRRARNVPPESLARR